MRPRLLALCCFFGLVAAMSVNAAQHGNNIAFNPGVAVNINGENPNASNYNLDQNLNALNNQQDVSINANLLNNGGVNLTDLNRDDNNVPAANNENPNAADNSDGNVNSYANGQNNNPNASNNGENPDAN